MKRPTWLLVILLCVALPAPTLAHPLEGGFTAGETASLLLLRDSMKSGLLIMRNQCGYADGRENDCADVAEAIWKTSQCVGWLFHVNVHANTKNGNTVLSWPRPQVVAKAWEECDRAAYEYSLASPSFGSNGDYLDAVASLGAVDRSLPYATPFPVFPDFPGDDEQNQFATHGQYSNAQSLVSQTLQYGYQSPIGWNAGISSGELPACPDAFHHMARGLSMVIGDIWFLSAHVIDSTGFESWLTPAEEQSGEESRRAFAQIHMMHGRGDDPSDKSASDRFRLASDAYATCLQAQYPNLWEAIRRLNDAWAHGDDWTGVYLEKR